MKERILLDHRWALGDTVILTALVRDIHAAYPGRFETDVLTNWTPVWWHNPYVTRFRRDDGGPPANVVKVAYDNGIAEAGRGLAVHMLAWYHEDFRRKTGLSVPVTRAGGDLHLTAEERRPFLGGRYWVVLSGGKLDITAKWWPADRYQKVVDALASFGVRCVQVGAAHSAHVHPPLRNVLDMTGKTDSARDLFGLILHADGVLCGVTGAMHIAAALDRPCVVVAGAREEPWWEAYSPAYGAFGGQSPRVPHRFLHTFGLLDCSRGPACWKKRTVPIEPDDTRLPERARKLCADPVRPLGSQPVPRCLDMISPDQVVEAVLSYYADGTLPPLR